jgi:dTDP-4-amino-4,6-dideoxygalactose transaminase/nucleoside-diphosphate-sugar epimerase
MIPQVRTVNAAKPQIDRQHSLTRLDFFSTGVSVSTVMIVIGGSGFLGTAVTHACLARGRDVVTLDRHPPRGLPRAGVTPMQVDILTDHVVLPPGHVSLVAGNSDPRTIRPWQLVLDNAIATARVLPMLRGRDVTLVSSIEVYGTAPGPLTKDTTPALPVGDDAIAAWCLDAVALAREPCPPWRAAQLCRELTDLDPTGRWVYALAKRAQELLVASVVPAHRLTVLRAANVFGLGQDRVVARLARRALAGLPLVVTGNQRTFLAVEDLAEAIARGGPPGLVNAGVGHLWLPEVAALVLDELGLHADVEVRPPPPEDSAGVVDTRAFWRRAGYTDDGHLTSTMRSFVRRLRDETAEPLEPCIPVVIPPRPVRPDVVGERIQAALWSGIVKSGGPWTSALSSELRGRLGVDYDREVIVTSSGTAALRLAILAVAGPGRPGDVAVIPSFTFVATAEVLVQLGYRLRFCDVRSDTWNLDAEQVVSALSPGDVRVVVAVDALGAPADYTALNAVCRRHGVPLVADSAPSLGGSWQGRPLGTQADAHAFSMSFAKVVSAAGGGGAVVVPVEGLRRLQRPVDWIRSATLGEVHAAAALDLVENLDELTQRRRRVADIYAELESAASEVVPQRVSSGDDHAFVHWVARFSGVDRDRLAKELDRLGVGTKPYYGPVLHHLSWGGAAEEASTLPVTDLLATEALALPMSSELSTADAERVFWTVLNVLDGLRVARP